MAGIPCAVKPVCLAILLCCHVANSQDAASGGSNEGPTIPQGAGQMAPVDDGILVPVDEKPIEEPKDDAPDPQSCHGKCLSKCNEMPLDCEFVGDSLPVLCENNRDKCPGSCDSICECVDVCKEECTTADYCKENCMYKCFKEHDFQQVAGDEGTNPPVLENPPPPNAV